LEVHVPFYLTGPWIDLLLKRPKVARDIEVVKLIHKHAGEVILLGLDANNGNELGMGLFLPPFSSSE
jgi:hypothetical protein